MGELQRATGRMEDDAPRPAVRTRVAATGGERASLERAHHLPGPELPRAGARASRSRSDRAQHRPDRGRRAPQLVPAAARTPARRAWPGRCQRGPGSAPAHTSTVTRCGCTTACAARSGSGSPCSSPIRPACSTPSGWSSARSRCCARTRSAPVRTCVRGLSGTVVGFVVGGGAVDRDRHERDLALAPAAARDPVRRRRSRGDLLRRRAGGVHADAGVPVQHHPARPAGGSACCASRTWRSAAR